ncbi:MAG: DUF402 domain-containing protein [Lachnospiraceae bacterium]|nr:DUF402 domain-containing protein [Lachnospiraceae bacterium]
MDHPVLYRKRIIPEEKILLKDDVIISCDEDMIITKWNTLKPREDFHHGYSIYYLKEGYKVSKFCKMDGSLKYWYCDIVDYDYDKDSNELVVSDLLVDVIIYPDGGIKVDDIDELVEALDKNLISLDILKNSLLKLNKLLQILYSGQFDKLKKPIPVDWE